MVIGVPCGAGLPAQPAAHPVQPHAPPQSTLFSPSAVSFAPFAQLGCTQTPMFVADLALKDEKLHWAAPVPKDNPKLRAELQDALDCMKKDGSLPKLYEKWIGPSDRVCAGERGCRVSYPSHTPRRAG